MFPPPDLIQRHFGLSSFSIRPMGRYWQLKTDCGRRFLLKPISSNLKDVVRIWELLNYLTKVGYHSSTPWQTTKDSCPTFYWQGKYWALIRWITGKPAPVFTVHGFSHLLQLLSDLHNQGLGCSIGSSFIPSQVYSNRLLDLKKGFKVHKTSKNSSGFSLMYKKALSDFIQCAHLANSILNRLCIDEQTTVCHGDPSMRNTVNTPDGRWILIDWERIVNAPGWWEISQAIRRFGYANSWRSDHMRKVWFKLNQSTLAEKEKFALLGALYFPQEFWRLGYQYFVEDLPQHDPWFAHHLKVIILREPQRRATLNEWMNRIGW
jgi:hypothetical protein